MRGRESRSTSCSYGTGGSYLNLGLIGDDCLAKSRPQFLGELSWILQIEVVYPSSPRVKAGNP